MTPSKLRWWLTSLAVVSILALTLGPVRGDLADHPPFCVICGQRGAADALLNFLMFAPFGAALAWWRLTLWQLLLAAGALSTLIEVVQIAVPGRNPGLGDIGFNILGAVFGMAVARTASLWFYPSQRQARLLCSGGTAAALAIAGTSAGLLQPDLPRGSYHGHWTPASENLETYRGHIREAGVGTVGLENGHIADSIRARVYLLRGVPLRIMAEAGPAPEALASIFSIYDEKQREVLFVGVDRSDAVFRFRARSATLRFEQPTTRVHAALSGSTAGMPLQLRLWRWKGGYCLEVNRIRACPVGFTVGDGWRILVSSPTPPRVDSLIDFIWLAALFAPAGFWLVRWRHSVIVALVATIGLAAMGEIVGILPTTLVDWLAAVTGLALGCLLRRASQRALVA